VNDDARQTIIRLEALKKKASRNLVYAFGSGAYGLMAVFDDGSQRLKAYGFDTAADAALFRAFSETAESDSPERLEALMEQLGYDTTLSSAKWLRFDVVRIEAHIDIAGMLKRVGDGC
jgi:hypothetical protein